MISSLQKAAFKSTLENPDAFATSLVAILIDTYGVECFEWEPDTLRMQLNDDFGAGVPQVNYDKIWSAATLLTTDLFYKSVELFNASCNAFSGSEADFNHWDMAAPEEIMWGVTEAFLLDPPTKNEPHEFSNEIRDFVGLILRNYGIWKPPALLKPLARMPDIQGDPADFYFSDDPTMYAAFSKHQDRTMGMLEQQTIDRLHAMIAELHTLPLQNGKVDALDTLKLPAKRSPEAGSPSK